LTHNPKPATNPHKTPSPETRLSRLLLFLEAQFGADAVSPIQLPRYSTTTPPTPPPPSNPSDTSTTKPQPDAYSVATSPTLTLSPTGIELSPEDKTELKRLHTLGIPVPGIEIKFDKYVAKVWLEDLEVECASAPLRGRVKAVVERSVETVSGLWA
jgi:cleavage and polyadenylation specificity factor subunit 3